MITITWSEYHGFVNKRDRAKIGPSPGLTIADVTYDRISSEPDKPYVITCYLPGIKSRYRARDLEHAKTVVQKMVDTFAEKAGLTACQWYALCRNQTDSGVQHLVLGLVPTCKRCADKHDLERVLLP